MVIPFSEQYSFMLSNTLSSTVMVIFFLFSIKSSNIDANITIFLGKSKKNLEI